MLYNTGLDMKVPISSDSRIYLITIGATGIRQIGDQHINLLDSVIFANKNARIHRQNK